MIATVASIAGAQTFSYSDKSAPDQATSTYIVRAWDGAAHSVDSNAVAGARRLHGRERPQGASPRRRPRPRRPCSPGLRRARSPSITTTSTATDCSSARRPARERRSRTPPRPRARTTTPCSPATPDPSRACSPRRSRWSSTGPRRRAEARRPRRCSRADRSTSSGRPQAMRCPASPDTSFAARAEGSRPPPPTAAARCVRRPQPGCSDASAATGTWSYGVFARDAAGNVALIGTVSNVVVVDKTPPLAPTKLTVTRAEGKVEVEEHHAHPALGQADGSRPRPHGRRAQPQARSRRARRRQGRLPRPRHLRQGQAARQGRSATSPSTPTTTAATTRTRRCARRCRWHRSSRCGPCPAAP